MKRILTLLMMFLAAGTFTNTYAQGGTIATCSAGHDNWEPTEHRSAQGFTITIQGDVLNAYSNKAYENVAIQITDADGRTLLYKGNADDARNARSDSY